MTEPIRVFLDSTVHLFAYRSAKTNSSLVLAGMDGVLFQPVVSYKTLAEIQKRTRDLYGKDIAGLVRWNLLMLPKLIIVTTKEIAPLLSQYDEYVRDKADLPHICAYFAANCRYFVTSNRRLTKMDIGQFVNFTSPREFVEETLRARPYDTPGGI
jgi:predicted nucleic acid-binding protein